MVDSSYRRARHCNRVRSGGWKAMNGRLLLPAAESPVRLHGKACSEGFSRPNPSQQPFQFHSLAGAIQGPNSA